MKFMIYCVDAPDSAKIRQQHRPAHLEYMIAVKHKIVFGGPFRSDDMSKTLGSLIVSDLLDREAVNTFLQDEPYFKNGVFESVIVRAIDIMVPERNPNFLSQELDREKQKKHTQEILSD